MEQVAEWYDLNDRTDDVGGKSRFKQNRLDVEGGDLVGGRGGGK